MKKTSVRIKVVTSSFFSGNYLCNTQFFIIEVILIVWVDFIMCWIGIFN